MHGGRHGFPGGNPRCCECWERRRPAPGSSGGKKQIPASLQHRTLKSKQLLGRKTPGVSKKSLALQDSVPPGRVQQGECCRCPPRTPCEAGAKEFVSLLNTPGATEPHGYFGTFPAFPLGVLFHQADPPVPRLRSGRSTAGAAPHGTDPSAAPRGSARPHSHPLSPHEASGPKKGQMCPQSCSCSGGGSQGHPAPGAVPVPTHTAPHRLAPKRTSERGCGWKAKNKNKKIRSWG